MIQEKTVRIVVIQGYCLLRDALIGRLEQESWIEVCAAGSGGEETRELIDLHRPHVLVINVSLKCSVGILSLRKLKKEFYGLAVVALSCDSEFENTYTGQVLRAGADGYVSSLDSPEDIIGAIRTVRSGERFVSRRTEKHQRENMEREKVFTGLSAREVEVFCLIGCGYAPQRIAEMTNLSVKTIESYRERIRKKMNLSNGADLLLCASNFMRSAARRGAEESDESEVRELLSATD